MRPFIQIGPKAAGDIIIKPPLNDTNTDAPGPIIQGTPILNGSYIINKNGYTFGGSQYQINMALTLADVAYLKQLMIDSNVHTLITEKGVFDGFIETINRNGFTFHVFEKTSETVFTAVPTVTDYYRAYIMQPWQGSFFYGFDDDADAFLPYYAPYELIEIPATSVSMSSTIRELDGTTNYVLNMFVQVTTPDITIADLIVEPYSDICITYVSYLDSDQLETAHYVMFGKVLDGFGSVAIYEGARAESLVIQGRMQIITPADFHYFDFSDQIRDRSSNNRTSLNTPWPRCPSGPSELTVNDPTKAIKRLIAGQYYKFNNGTDWFDMRSVRYDIRADSKSVAVSSE